MKGRALKIIAKNAPKENIIQIAFKMLGIDGGPGSGNFGHAGRPGKVGGSGKGGGSSYRTQTSKGSYIGVQKAKAFKSIAKQARSARDVKAFVKSLSKEQYYQLTMQYHNSGTKEDIWPYTERLMNVMKKQKWDKPPENKVVDGKDLTEKHVKFFGDTGKYNDPVTGQVVDEEIEDAMSKQGFLGFPKVVSQEEFDEITKEHPEMPLLYRSYTGRDAEQTQDYDDQLERGEWYVDCSKGGAQYGQGMYCAGVYQQEPLYRWDDPALDTTHWDLTVFTDARGNGFVTSVDVDPADADDLYAGVPYLVFNDDGTRSMLKMDDDSYLWTDMNTGAIYDDEKANEIIMRAKKIYECKEQDLGIYADANDKERKESIKGAMNEMRHYRRNSARIAKENAIPEPPEGKERVSDGDKHYYYDMKNMKAFDTAMPKDGAIIAIMNPRDPKFFAKYGASLWKVHRGYLIGLNDTGISSNPLKLSQVEPYEEWAEVEGECDKLNIDPVSSTRMMTLDPSAKIITYQEIRDYKNKGYEIRQAAREKAYREQYEFCKGKPEGVQELFDLYANGNSLNEEQMKKAMTLKKEHPEIVSEAAKLIERMNAEKDKSIQEAHKYDKLMHMDEGVLATLLGYDAINAEGHGESNSYTVVLNRTKLIISEQRVDVD